MNEDLIREKLVLLGEEHQDLDQAIENMTQTGTFNQLQLQRMKKRKLSLKDQMAQLNEMLVPDIIA